MAIVIGYLLGLECSRCFPPPQKEDACAVYPYLLRTPHLFVTLGLSRASSVSVSVSGQTYVLVKQPCHEA